MLLRRFSNRKGLTEMVVDKAYKGPVSSFSTNSYKAIETPRLFCYAVDSPTEPIVAKTGRYEYLVQIAPNRIYHIDLDLFNLDNLTDMISRLVDHPAYDGYSYSVGGHDMVCLVSGSHKCFELTEKDSPLRNPENF